MFENLFVSGKEEGTTSNLNKKELSEKSSEWTGEIIERLVEVAPYIDTSRVSVSFKKLDEEKGYGIGTISYIVTPELKADLPIIVQNYELFPLDVFAIQEKFFPLTEENWKDNVKNISISAGTEKKKALPANVDFDPPAIAQHQYRTTKTASILDSIKDTILEEDVVRFKSELEKNSSVLVAYEANETFSAIKKIASFSPAEEKSNEEIVSNLLGSDIFQITKEASDRYTVTSTPASCFIPVSNTYNKDEVIDFLMKTAESTDVSDIVNEIDSSGYITISKVAEDTSTRLNEDSAVGPKRDINSLGVYKVDTETSGELAGIAFPKVVDFDGKKTDDTIFTDGNVGIVQAGIKGVKSSKPIGSIELSSMQSDVAPGKKGFFFHQVGEDAIATQPIVIENVTKANNNMVVQGVTLEGKQVNLCMAPNVVGITKINTTSFPDIRFAGEEAYLVPEEMKFMSYNKTDKPDNAGAEKTAADKKITIHSNNDGTFDVSGDTISKMTSESDVKSKEGIGEVREGEVKSSSFKSTGIPESKASLMLVSAGISPDNAKKYIGAAKESGAAEISTPSSEPKGADEAIEKIEKKAEIVREICNMAKACLVKEAAVFDDSETVDAVLSLNFVNPANMTIFVESLPMFENVVNKLGQLLILQRIGDRNIPEKAIKSAFINLQKVTKHLNGVKTYIAE
jgi:hypothetical protein